MDIAVESRRPIGRPRLSGIIEQARGHRVSVALAYPCDAASLEAAVRASEEGLAEPVLVGPRSRILNVASRAGLNLGPLVLVDTPDNPRLAARHAARLCREGEARVLMKGSLHSDEFLAAALCREYGVRAERRISHVYVMDVPELDRALLITDAAVNIAPTLAEKVDITRNAIDLAHALGITLPRVAILSAIETVSPSIPGTVDAAALCKMADRKQITGAVVDGPLAFDNAISERAARDKGIESPVAGRPDVLVLPNLEAGNMVCKQLVYMGGAECAGIVVGAGVPIVLTSRSDSILSRVASCALAALQNVRADAEQRRSLDG